MTPGLSKDIHDNFRVVYDHRQQEDGFDFKVWHLVSVRIFGVMNDILRLPDTWQ